MQEFEPLEELHNSIERFRSQHNGTYPTSILVSPALYQWLANLKREEALYKYIPLNDIDTSYIEIGGKEFRLQVDEALGNFEILAE